MKKKLVSLLLTGSVVMTSFSTNIAFANERYSAYEDNINSLKYQDVTHRLKKITKKVGEYTLPGADYTYNEQRKITRRNYPEGTIEYKYDEDGKVVEVLNKLKGLSEDDKKKLSIIHVEGNFKSKYIYGTDGETKGKIVKEIKEVFGESDTELTDPVQRYEIDYEYDGGTLYSKTYTAEDSSEKKEFTRYEYSDGRISKITENKNGAEQSMTLKYDDDGDIIEAVQIKNGKQTTRKISYLENSVYPIYFVDPVKEHKVDLDFFASSYKLIKEMTVTEEDKETVFKYEYDDKNAPTESTLTVLKDGKEIKVKYLLEY